MGEVYRARDVRLGRDVAVKVLPAELAGDRERLRRFEQEARSVAALSHPNILAIHDVGTHEGAPYLVTELLEGETLRARLQGGALAPRKAIDLGAQIAQGLAAAHERGIVHRDLKPGNVFVTSDGHVKILDFGLAKAVVPGTAAERAAASTMEAVTDLGRVMGTAAYMSPEQVRGVPVDHRSDIFSLGVVLYEMATGRQAFARDSTTETMAAILKEEPPDPSSVSKVVPTALSRAVAHCLEKRPEDRFQTARDLAFELKSILDDTTGARTAAHQQRRRWAAAAGAAILVVGAGLAVGLRLVRWPARAITATNFRLVSTFPGSHRWPTFSPDGSMIAFVSDADGSPQLWVKNLAGGDPIKITSGNLNPSHPSWSPKNDQIVFQGGERLEEQSLWSLPPLGGQPRRLLEGAFAPSFSADGARLAFHRSVEGVWVCNSDGSGERRVDDIPSDDMAHAFDDGPVFSPDGTLLAYYAAFPGIRDVWVAPIAGGRPRRLTTDDSEGGHPTWTRDGRSIVYSSSRTGSRNLWRIAAGGGKPEPVTSGAGDDGNPVLSRNGRTLVYTNVRNTYALMALDVATGDSRQVLEQRTPIAWPSFSPAGDRIAFNTSAFGGGLASQAFVVASDGTRMQPVTAAERPSERMLQPLHWSADGRFLYVLQILPGPPELSCCRLPAGGGPCVPVAGFLESGHGTWGIPSFSPDGRKIALNGAPGEQQVRAFVRDLATGTTVTLPVLYQFPHWSHDGRALVGVVAGRGQIFVCPPDGAPCTEVAKASVATMAFFSHDDSRIFFFATGDPPTEWELRTVNRDGSGMRVIAQLPSLVLPGGFPFGLSSDDRVPWVQLRPGRHELWKADLQR
jgi:serine/threonine protein kinase